MLKKTILIATVLLLIASLTGCSCNGTTAAPSPSPSASPEAAATPMIITPEPEGSASPDAAASPDLSASPDANASGQASTATTIENFQEGTEVREADVPNIVKAVQEKYENAKIQSIKHATNNGAQVYAVELTSGSKTQTVYVAPDGTVTEKAS